MGIKTVKLVWILLLALITSSAVHAELPITPPPSNTGSGGGDTTPVALKPDADILKFANKDTLHGNLLSIEADKLTWRYPNIPEPMVFPLSFLRGVSLGPRSETSNKGDIQLFLTNKDILPGKLVSIDKHTITIATNYAGEIKIPLPMVRQIILDTTGARVYMGPNSKDEWSSKGNANSFDVANGTLSLEASTLVWTKLNLPDMARFSFELQPKFSRGTFLFYADDKFPRRSPNAYKLSIYSSNFEFERYTDNSGTDTINDSRFKRVRNAPIKVDIFVNKKDRRFTLQINGKTFGPYTDDYGQFAGKGQNIAFANESGSTMRIRNIVVSQWDGSTIPGRVSSSSDNTKSHDTIFFANNDRASGTLISATPKQVVFKTDFAELKAPPSRISMILLASDKRQIARKQAEDIAAMLRGGGRVTFALGSIKNGIATGSSENFGETKFNLSAFTSMEFNIYNTLLRENEPSPDTDE